jgi:hypothetical protein
MRHHLYGILERPPAASRLPEAGVEERPVVVRRIGGLVVLSSLVEATPRPTPSALSRHHDVQAAMTTPGPFFPLEYGVAVPSSEIEEWLAFRAGFVRSGLQLVRGRVEMRVRVLALRFGAGDPTRLREVADRVTSAAGVGSWRSHVSGTHGNAAISLAFLVPRAEVAAFLSRIAPLASRSGDVAVVPSGPWPASTFVPSLPVEDARLFAPERCARLAATFSGRAG